jgi:hypothetical protein
MRTFLSRRRARWVAPVAAAGAIAIGAALSTATAGASSPDLPGLTPAQVIAKAAHPTLQGFSGTVELTSNLGLPDLSSLTNNAGQSVQTASGFDPTTLLTGTHDINVWDNGGKQQRLQLQSQLAETDLVRSGHDAWLWDSSTQTVTHYVTAPQSGTAGTSNAGSSTAGPTGSVPLTPEQEAQKWLDHISPSTQVTVDSPVNVDGRDAYQLTLAPKAGTPGAGESTISSVTMAVDNQTGAVLSIALNTVGQAQPALSLVMKNFQPGTPAASNFAAPTGTTTKTQTIGGDHQSSQAPSGQTETTPPSTTKPQVSDTPWAQVLTIPNAHLSAKDLSTLNSVSSPVAAGRLVHTNVVNAIVEPSGTVLVGFVQPSVLEAQAGS